MYIGEVDVWLHLFLISTQDGGELLTSRPSKFSPETGRRYPLHRGLDGPQNQPGRFVEGKKQVVPDEIRNPDFPARGLGRTSAEVSQYPFH